MSMNTGRFAHISMNPGRFGHTSTNPDKSSWPYTIKTVKQGAILIELY